MTDVIDPWATPEDVAVRPREDAKRRIITAGRYRLPNRDGSKKSGGWQRVTNLVSAFSDQFGLRMWEFEQMMTAAYLDTDRVLADLRLTMDAMSKMTEKKDRRFAVEAFVDRCKDIAGGNAGTAFGNLRHALVEADHLALPMGAPDAYAREHLALFRSALVRNRLVRLEGMAERRVLIEELDAIGTLDAILNDLVRNVWTVGDLKTQKRFWTWLEIAAQEACYANAVAMWESSNDPADATAGRWVDMPPVSKEIAHVLWMPREPVDPLAEPDWRPHVDVYEVDIVAGWKTAKLAREIVIDRAGGKAAKSPRAWLRHAPDVTLTEQYAARFAAVDTAAEGRALVAECKRVGVWSVVLADEAARAKSRIEKLAVWG